MYLDIHGWAARAVMLAPLDALLSAPGFSQDPYPAYRQLREIAPLYWSEAWNAWISTGYDDIVGVLRDHARFSSAGRLLELLDGLPPDLHHAAEPIRHHFSTRGLIHADPPDHQRLRSLIGTAFSARVIAGIRERIEGIVGEHLDRVTGDGRMDIVADLAHPLPAIVIAELLGAPPADAHRFQGWSDDIVAFQGTGRAIPEAVPRSATGLREMRAYLEALFEERRRNPTTDDLLGNLVAVEVAGERLTTEELYSTCVTFLIGGHETTTSLIANGLYCLLRYPAALTEVRTDPSALGPAIEECLRFESPIQRTFRRVVADTSVDSQHLRRGQIIIQLLGAANRDPSRFSDPDRFDIHREPNRHIAFGSGVHYCIGAALARMEASIAIAAVIRRCTDLELATDSVTWQREKTLFRSVASLPVRFRTAETLSPRSLSRAGALPRCPSRLV